MNEKPQKIITQLASQILEGEIRKIGQNTPKQGITTPIDLSAKQLHDLMNSQLGMIPRKICSIKISNNQILPVFQQGEFIVVKGKKLLIPTQQTIQSEAVGNLIQNYRAGTKEKEVIAEGTVLREIWNQVQALAKKTFVLIVTHKYKILIAAGICVAVVMTANGFHLGKKLALAKIVSQVQPIIPGIADDDFTAYMDDFLTMIERVTEAKIRRDTPSDPKKTFFSSFFATAQEVNENEQPNPIEGPIDGGNPLEIGIPNHQCNPLFLLMRGDLIGALQCVNEGIDLVGVIFQKICKISALKQLFRTITGQRLDLNDNCTVDEVIAHAMREIFDELSRIDFTVLTEEQKQQTMNSAGAKFFGKNWLRMKNSFGRFLCAYAETDAEFSKYSCERFFDIILPSMRVSSLHRIGEYIYTIEKLTGKLFGAAIFATMLNFFVNFQEGVRNRVRGGGIF